MAAELTEHDNAVLNCVFNPSLPLEEASSLVRYENLTEIEDDTPETEKSKKLEKEAIIKAEEGDITASKELLTRAIIIAPKRASLYNNRAQICQLEGRMQDALDDVSKAINLATDNQQRTKCQAFCQKGVILRKMQQDDNARACFEKAAKMGSVFARNQLIEMNPYAALCNQMLRKALNDFK